VIEGIRAINPILNQIGIGNKDLSGSGRVFADFIKMMVI
jgi:hypothetical protein